MNVQGKRALVTGGSAGIGYEIARQLAGNGAHVVIAGRDSARLGAAAAAMSGKVEIFAADLAVTSEQDRLVTETARRWPDLAVLINNAGVQINLADTGIGDDGRMAELRAEVALNLMAPAVLSFGLMPLLARQPEAAIVNVSSGLALAPKRQAPVYCATKAGLSTFSTALRYRCEDAVPQIRVIEVVMAYVDTDMTRGRGGAKMPAADAAREVVAGIENDRREVWVGKTKALRVIHRIVPSLARRMLRNG